MLRNVARDLGAAFEARIDQSLRLELCQRVAIGIEIVRLTPHRLFPADAEPSEIFIDRLLELGSAARRIDILDAQQEPPAEIARHIAQHTGAPWPHDPDGSPLYPGTAKQLTPDERARRIAAGEPYALRLDTHAAIKRTGALTWVETGSDPKQDHETQMAEPQMWGDVILARKDTQTSYHLSVVLEDALQGVTHVVRGQDLYQATSVHRVLQTLLDLPTPLYHHHRLILDAEGHKLSKSTHATALCELRRQGRAPADIRRMVGLA